MQLGKKRNSSSPKSARASNRSDKNHSNKRASSAALGGAFLLMITVAAALAYSIAGSENTALASVLNDFLWVSVVLSSFPRAMLIMAGTFGLWRAGLFSNARFAAGPQPCCSSC